MSNFTVLEQDNLFCHYDDLKKLIFVTYRKSLTPKLTAQAYEWVRSLAPAQDEIRGAIFDFRDVRHFESSNFSTSQRESTELTRQFNLDAYAVALIVSNTYQERLVATTIKITPQQERKKIVYSYEDAFKFVRDYDAKLGREHQPSQDPLILDSDGASVYYDEEAHSGRITYYGVVTMQVTADVYARIYQMGMKYDIKTVRGGVFDFRHVTEFDNSNLRTVQRTATNLKQSFDMSNIATPLIVGTISQERMVLTAMKVTQDEKRKKIVYNYTEALNFIQHFHASQVSDENRS